MQISQLKETRSEADRTLDFRTLDFQITQLTKKVTTLHEQNKLSRAKNGKIKQHYKELYDSIKITRAKHIKQTTALLTKNENLKVQIHNKMQCDTTNPIKPRVLAPGVNSFTDASGSQPKSNTKKNRILPAKSVNKKNVEEHPRTNKSNLKTKNHVDSSISSKRTVVQIVLWYLDSGCSKHMTGDRSQLRNFMKNFIRTVRFGNDHFGAIMGYGDYVISDSVISRDGVELIKGSHSSNLYTILAKDMMKSSPICLLSKSSKNKSWLWHRRLNHLNFGTINDLARKDLVICLPRLKFEKDHFCSTCQLGKSKKHTHKPKTENTNLEVLNTLHIDLCRPMRVQTINGKKYILVIVDDYSRFTWVKFLRSKDETPEVVIKFLKQIQVGINKTIRYIRTDNGAEFINKDLTAYYERVGVFQKKSVPRTPQQNDIVKRWNRTLVEAARTILIFSKAPMFLWAEAVATACYTQNRSLIHTLHNKTPYELVHDKKPDLTFFRVFGALCYPTNDSEDIGKLQPIADIGIFVGYAPSRKGYKIYNKRTRRIMESIHVQFDELTEQMAPVQLSRGPTPTFLMPGQIKPPRVERPISPAPAVPILVNSAGTPSSTTIDQDAPSPSHSLSSSVLQSPSIHQGVAAESTLVEENLFTPVDNDPFINIFAPEPTSEAPSSGDVSSVESTYVTQTLHHLGK
ncbi:retrovirus-related pol polyprotein from transposon TNT 1-94 [Tanacetum coccineum]